MLRGPLFHKSWGCRRRPGSPAWSQHGRAGASCGEWTLWGGAGSRPQNTPHNCPAGRGVRRWACPAERAWAQGGGHPELLNLPDPARGVLLGPELRLGARAGCRVMLRRVPTRLQGLRPRQGRSWAGPWGAGWPRTPRNRPRGSCQPPAPHSEAGGRGLGQRLAAEEVEGQGAEEGGDAVLPQQVQLNECRHGP